MIIYKYKDLYWQEGVQPLKKLMILDGNSIVNRAFYGVRLLTNKDGLYTNAIYGFLNILFKYISEEQPTHLCVAFDVHAPTFRHKSFESYKAQRKGMPDELKQQMPVLKDVLSAMNIKMLELEGYEADDIIGTVSIICENSDTVCVILTGDKDDLQLASKNTIVKLITTKSGVTDTVDYTDETVMEKFGVTPSEFIDVKGLMGDPSDNIPGVAGVGEKTAFSLIKSFHSIENLYDNIDDKSISNGVRNKLTAGKDSAFNSKFLATIVRNAPVDFNIDDCLIKEYDNERLFSMFSALNFNGFIKKLNLASKTEYNPEISEDRERLFSNINDKKTLFYYYDSNICLASTCSEDITIVDLKDLYQYFSDAQIKKYSHNIKEHIVEMNKEGVNYENAYFDTMIAYYIINPSATDYSLDTISAEVLGSVSENQLYNILKLHEKLSKQIENDEQNYLFYNIEMPLVEVLASMQISGVKADKEKLIEFQAMLEENINSITSKIYDLSGVEFNINSPKQLGEVLFEKLHLPVIKKTKSGYSTSAEVLEKLKGTHEIIELIMEYRHLVKLKGTYADGLISVIDDKTGKIYSNFNQTVTVTGRISSTEPNLQNIPVRTELGREVRKMFTATDDNHILVDADYSQIELRVLAHISGDRNMTEAFKNSEDIHTRTACKIFGVSPNEVTPQMRSRAKTVNFGIVYGMGDFSLAQELGIKKSQAKEYIDNYFQQFDGVKQYMENIVETAKEDGYVKTLFNRRRYLPELSSGNFIQRSFGERVAMNTPIQGTAADIIKIAMVNIYKRLKKENLKSKLVLQVHDELIIDALKTELDKVKQILKYEMENAAKLNIPLVADMNVGETWYEAK